MEAEILQSLEDVGYTGSLSDINRLNKAFKDGPKSPEFTNLVSWLTCQISLFEKFSESVHPTLSPEDSDTFLMELSSFLKEAGCVNQKLISGSLNQRLSNVDDRYTLIDYLISELMACKIHQTNKPENNKSVQITISESITAKNLREMLTAIKIQKPPDNITATLLFDKLNSRVNELIKQVPRELLGKPLFFGELNKNQWEKLDQLQGDLNEEYTIRREMLLKRLDVTVNSFLWSERIRPKENDLNKCFYAKRDLLNEKPDVNLACLLAARDDLAIVEKTSNASVRKNTKSDVNKVIIGNVPDRGGRAYEQEPPPPEMPPWQKNRVAGPSNFGGGGRGGGNRGGGGGRGGGGRGDGGGRGGYQDHKSVASNFGQNYSSPSTGYGNQSSNYGGPVQVGYRVAQGSNYSSNSGSGGYNNPSPKSGPVQVNYRVAQGYQSNQNSSSENQGSGNYHKSNRGGRVQGGWNQEDSRNNYNRDRGNRY